MTARLSITGGPHPPVTTVPSCDIGGERLPTDRMWWLVAIIGQDDRHAACAGHAGVDEVPYTPPAARVRGSYVDSVEAANERSSS